MRGIFKNKVDDAVFEQKEKEFKVHEYHADKEDKDKFNPAFFCVCPKCDTRIFQHIGFTEFPAGLFTFRVVCTNGDCGEQFEQKMSSRKGNVNVQAQNIMPIIKQVMKEMQKDKE